MTSYTKDLFISYAQIHAGISIWVSHFDRALPDGEM